MPNLIDQMELQPTGRKFLKPVPASPLDISNPEVICSDILDEYTMSVTISHTFRSEGVHYQEALILAKEGLARYIYSDTLLALPMLRSCAMSGDIDGIMAILNDLDVTLFGEQ